MWCCVAWWVVPDVSKDNGTFIFRVKQPYSWTTKPTTQHHIQEDFNLHQHSYENLESCTAIQFKEPEAKNMNFNIAILNFPIWTRKCLTNVTAASTINGLVMHTDSMSKRRENVVLIIFIYTANTAWDPYGSVMWKYMIPSKIFNMKMKIYKPLHSYPILAY